MLGNRYSQHSFAQIPSVNMARSQFDRSFTVKDTFDFDYLTPIFVDEILPGDTANVTLNMFARLATQVKPTMDNMFIDFFFFFVPNRLVWEHWEKFNGAQDNPNDTTDYIVPQMTLASNQNFAVGSIYDKMGLPTGVNQIKLNNTLPLRAYNLIWNEWFRDQNMQDSITVPKDDGPDEITDYALRKRGKRHDYFTSALPWPQKGPAVEFSLGGIAPLIANPDHPTIRPLPDGYHTYVGFKVPALAGGYIAPNVAAGSPNIRHGGSQPGSGQADLQAELNMNQMQVDTSVLATGMLADLSDATAGTVNQLREAIAVQSLFELDARGGTRYVEILRSHFNVISPDFRLQRPEYLGGGSVRINSHPVQQTSASETDKPLAGLAAFSTASSMGNNIGFTKSFVEHGYVIGMACARADLTYQQGMNRMWNRSTRLDFFWPKLQELGEQTILNKEIYTQGQSVLEPDGVSVTDDQVFGYQERFAEYRFKPSEIHGEFRSTYAQSLDVWHLAEEFSALPTLSPGFIAQSTPIERVLAVTNEPALIADYWFNYKHARPMVAYSVPSTLGRF